MNPTDTNQASEDEQINDVLTNAIDYYISGNGVQPEAISRVKSLINQQIKSVLDELVGELDDGKNSHSMKVISSTIQKIRSRYE